MVQVCSFVHGGQFGWQIAQNLKLTVFRSWQNKKKPKCSTVTWTGIQQALHQAQSDVLILLDCCSSGIGDVGEGNGVTELMSACAFDVVANGVGHYSFTKALTTELRLLSKKSSFPVGELYANIYCRIQYHLTQGVAGERYPAPIHLQLTRDDEFPRGLLLSVQQRPEREYFDLGVDTTEFTTLKRALPAEPSPSEPSNKRPCCSNGSKPAVDDLLRPKDAPRLLFAIRLEENIRAEDLSPEYFIEWLRAIPTAVEEVKVEAGFKSDSTLLLVSVPLLLWPYLPQCPATFLLGPIRSLNIMASRDPNLARQPPKVFSRGGAKEKTVAAIDDKEVEVVVLGKLYYPNVNLRHRLESYTPDSLRPVQYNKSKGTRPHLFPTPNEIPINPNPIIDTLNISNTIDEASGYNSKDFHPSIFTWLEGALDSRRLNLQGDILNIGSFAYPFYKMDPNKYFSTTRRYHSCPTGYTKLRRIKFVPYTA
jgi:hypothetical protein